METLLGNIKSLGKDDILDVKRMIESRMKETVDYTRSFAISMDREWRIISITSNANDAIINTVRMVKGKVEELLPNGRLVILQANYIIIYDPIKREKVCELDMIDKINNISVHDDIIYVVTTNDTAYTLHKVSLESNKLKYNDMVKAFKNVDMFLIGKRAIIRKNEKNLCI